jgi:hypothetical protein
MNNEILNYNSSQTASDQKICIALMDIIDKNMPEAKSKFYHGSPVWFIDDNPIVGYSKLKSGVQLLFWSGQTFDEEGLKPMGKYKAAEARYTDVEEINKVQLKNWLIKSIEIQWDYKNIVKRKGELLRLK